MSYLANPHVYAAAGVSEFYPVANTQGSASSYTVNFGDEHENRYIIAAISSVDFQTNGSVTAVTIGGVAATKLLGTSASATNQASFWIAAVPTGTSGNIVITHDHVLFVITVYRAVNLATTTPHGSNTVSPIVLTVPSLGVAIVTASGTGGADIIPGKITFTDDLLKSYEYGRSQMAGFGIRAAHTWKVCPTGDSLSSTITWTASNKSEIGISLLFSYPFAPPVPFESSHWSVADAVTDGELLVTITTVKNTGVTDIEYQLDGGSWVSSGTFGMGKSFAIPGLTNGQEYDVAIRPVTVSGTGATSDVKSATPTDGGATITYVGLWHGGNNIGAGPIDAAIYGGGHPKADRVIIVGFVSHDSLGGSLNDPTVLTINGVSATKLTMAGTGSSRIAQLWSAVVPDGDDELHIKVTTTQLTTNRGFTAWKSYGLPSASPGAVANNSSSPTSTVSLSCPPDGFITGLFRGNNANDTTWAGLTESADVVHDATSRLSAATGDFASEQIDLTVSAGQTSGTANRMAAAAFGSYSVPWPFRTTGWSTTHTGNSGEISITVIALPNEGGSAITDIEYRLDSGSWVSLGSTALTTHTISGLTDGQTYSVTLRAVNSSGGGTAGTAKTVTPDTFPIIRGSTSGRQNSAVASHPITMPASVAVGELLTVLFAVSANCTVSITSGTGWTISDQDAITGLTTAIITKIADGSDTLTLGTSVSGTSQFISHRITGSNGTVSNSSVSNGTTSTPNPPSHTPAGGSKKYLWLVMISTTSSRTLTTPSSGFTAVLDNSGAGGSLSSSQRNFQGSSLDPASATLSGSGTITYSRTISVDPV